MILVFPKKKQKGMAGESLIGLRLLGISVLLFLLLFLSFGGFGTWPDLFLLPNAYQLHTLPPFLPSKLLTLLSIHPSHPDCEARVVQGSMLW